MNGFSTGEEDSRGATDQICCLVDEGERCSRPAGNASYSKRIQKTVTQRRLKLNLDQMVLFAQKSQGLSESHALSELKYREGYHARHKDLKMKRMDSI